MQHLFSPEGLAALGAALRQQPLLAFDFDGTLAPIVARPDDARIPQAVATRLKALATQLPLAIVTGRTVADVRGRLGFEPLYIVGNHGAEDPQAAAMPPDSPALQSLRTRLRERRSDLSAAGVAVEDKQASLALHYRLARDRARALALVHECLGPADERLRVFGGKMVVNVMPREAPDKAAAVLALVQRCGAHCAVFAGDDVNDEPVFEAAPPHWLTLRVGCDERPSRARYFLGGTSEMALALDRMLALLPSLETD